MAIPLGDGFGSVGSCGEVVALSTNTTTTLSPPSRAIYISVDGTLNFLAAFSTASVTVTVSAGGWLPIRAKAVYAAPAGSIALW